MRQTVQHGNWRWFAATPVAAMGHAGAAPIDGEAGSNAAALLVLLGLGALVMGLRNLRELRHKRLTPERRYPPHDAQPDGD